MVVFTTANNNYAIEGYNLNAVDYLLKPFSFERFLQAANKCFKLNKLTQNNFVDVNQNSFFKTPSIEAETKYTTHSKNDVPHSFCPLFIASYRRIYLRFQ